MSNRYPKKIKQECLKLFLEGKTLKEITALKNVPFETLKKWHLRNNWAKENKKTVLKVSEKITDLVSEENAKEAFDVRQKIINHIKCLEQILDALYGKEIADEQLKVQLKDLKFNIVHLVLIFNVLHRYLYAISKIDGLIVDKSKNEADVNVAYAITKILAYRRQGIYSDNPYLAK